MVRVKKRQTYEESKQIKIKTSDRQTIGHRHIYKQTERQTDRQTNKQTGRPHVDRQT